MKFLTKHKKPVKIIFVLAIILFIVLFATSHSTSLKYNDWWIVGNSIQNVEQRYGKFDRTYYGVYDGTFNENGDIVGYYLYEDNSPIMPSHNPMYYWIKYNSDGIVEKVYVDTVPGG